MSNNSFKIVKENFDNDLQGESLLIDVESLRNQFEYLGLWYARDGNQSTSITTELYYSSQQEPNKPIDFNEELKENSFKHVNRFELSLSHKWIWIATRIDNNRYCRLKTGAVKQGRLYINFKLLHIKAYGFDVLDTGLFKGGKAVFFPLGSEDLTGKIDYTDAVMYLVMIKDLPPKDWNISDTFLGVEHLPIFSPIFKFDDSKKYSLWFENNPLRSYKKK